MTSLQNLKKIFIVIEPQTKAKKTAWAKTKRGGKSPFLRGEEFQN